MTNITTGINIIMIKTSLIRIPFWKAEETPSFICSAHRRAIVHGGALQVGIQLVIIVMLMMMVMLVFVIAMTMRALQVGIRAVRRQKKGAKKGTSYRRLYIVNAVLEASGRQALLL